MRMKRTSLIRWCFGAVLLTLATVVIGACGSEPRTVPVVNGTRAEPQDKVPGVAETAGPVVPAPDEPRSATAVSSTQALTGVGLAGDGLGWARTEKGLFITRDAGSAWESWPLPVSADAVLDVALLGPTRAYIATSKGPSVIVLSSSDGGRSWQSVELGAVGGGVGRASFSYQDERIAGLLVTRSTGSNFSVADWFTSSDDGARWTRHDAPVSGDVSLAPDGTLWLAGGPAHNRLFMSADHGAGWTPVALPAGLPAEGIAFDAPVARPDGLTVLSVTVQGVDGTSVVAFTSRDRGKSWEETVRASMPAAVGTGVVVPTSLAGETVLALTPDGSEPFRLRLTDGQAGRIPSSGLPKGAVALHMATERLGWAETSTASCGNGKAACTVTAGLFVTRNGGESWLPTTPLPGS